MTASRVATCAALFVAAAVRMRDIGRAVRLDEPETVRRAWVPADGFFAAAFKDSGNPLHQALMHYWVRVFGDSEVSIRIPSVLSGVLAVFLVERLVSRVGTRRAAAAGAAAAWMLALVPIHVLQSQNARTYALSTLLAVCSYHSIAALRERRSWAAPAYVLSTAALAFSHLYGIFILCAQNLHYGLARTLRWDDRLPGVRAWLALQAAVILLFAPWTPYFLANAEAVARSYWIPQPDAASFARAVQTYAGGGAAAAPVLLLAAFGAWRLAAGWRCLFASWLLAPLVLGWATSELVAPVFLTRYGLPASPALYALAAVGLAEAGVAVSIAFLAFFAAFSAPAILWPPSSDALREAARHLKTHAAPGDVVVAPFYSLRIVGHYLERGDVEYIAVRKDGRPTRRPSSTGYARVWTLFRPGQEPAGALGIFPPLRASRSQWFGSVKVMAYERAAE